MNKKTESIQDKRKVPFAMVEVEVLRDPNIKPHLKALYGLLISYGPERIFPGQQRLADEMGVTRPCMNKWLQDLRATGLIDWEQRMGTSNLYIILGPEGCNRTVTGGVNERLQGGVNERLHDLDLHDLDPPSNCAAAPLSQERQEQEPEQELPLHWKHVMIDDADFMHTCERCGEDFDVRQCKKSGARCPHCGYEGQVLDGLGSVSHRLPQGVRRKKEAVNPPLDGFGGKPVNALCALFNIAAGDLPPKRRAQWGHRLQDIASATNRDMEELIAALEAMREQFGWKDYGANPYRHDFEDNLLSVLLHSDESGTSSDLETVPLPELRARLAGGELRMDDLDAGEQAVVLARLGALP